MFSIILDLFMTALSIVAGLSFILLMIQWCVAMYEAEKARKSLDKANREYAERFGLDVDDL